MRITSPAKRAKPVSTALTAKRVEIKCADDPLVRADARAAPHAGASAARTPHDDMVQWTDATARKHSKRSDHRPRRPRQDDARRCHALAVGSVPRQRGGARADHGFDRPG